MERDEKIRQLEAMVAKTPDDATTLFLLGREYMEAGRHAEAADVLERCVLRHRDYTAAYRHLGDAHRMAGNAARAREIYEAGIAVSEETGDLQAGKEMAAMLKRLDKA